MSEDEQEPSSSGQGVADGHLHSWQLAIVVGALCLGVLLYGLDANIIGTAVPRITTEFKSLPDVAWYGAAYLVTVTAFQPFFGNMYRFFNTKIVYLVSIFIFEVGSILCASAPKSSVLIFGRAILGVGASGLLQGALAIIGYIVPLEKVPLFQGIVTSAVGISIFIGPIIGGALTEYATWRINVPAGAVTILIIFFFVPFAKNFNKATRELPLREKLRRIDAVGTVLFLGLVTSLLLALTWGGQQYAWRDSKIIGLFIGFGLILIVFCFWDWRRGELALIPLRVLRKRSICMGALVLFAYGIVLYVYGYYLPIFFQSVQGVTTSQSGVRYIAMVVPQIVSLVVAGAVVSIWGYYVPYMVAGAIVAAVGSGLLTTIGLDTPTVKWAAYLAVTGIGVGMASQLPYTALQVVLDPEDYENGQLLTTSTLFSALGLAIGQNLLLTGIVRAVPEYTTAITPAQVLAAGANGLTQLASSPMVLEALRRAYAQATRDVFILALAAAALTFPPTCAMEWLNITKESKNRAQNRAADEIEPSPSNPAAVNHFSSTQGARYPRTTYAYDGNTRRLETHPGLTASWLCSVILHPTSLLATLPTYRKIPSVSCGLAS
ncbi:MFS multidrug transporter-like protein [Xylaria grammica]|nr:MFS multidrug transporter-like protein [Xylaria grammica]